MRHRTNRSRADFERLADRAAHDQLDTDAAQGGTSRFGGLLARARDLRIGRYPYEISRAHAGEVRPWVAESQSVSIRDRVDGKDRPALFGIFGPASIEHDPHT